MKNKRGITLIALVITIVVMLILVGVSVSVALNGRLFATAEESVERTKKATESEHLYSLAMKYMKQDGTIDFSELENNLINTRF